MRMLIATDGSEYSRTAVEQACRIFGGAPDLRVKIVSTYEAAIPVDAFAPAAQYADENNRLAAGGAARNVAETEELVRARAPAAAVETEVVMEFAERFIVEAARAWRADLIVVGSHGRGFWGRLTLGSVSDGVLHHAPCPVFVGRARAAA